MFDPLHIRMTVGIFSAICEEMGRVLKRTAFSPNIKERKDFSCAIFDQNGDLLAQAAHIPIHLGSMHHAVIHAIRSVSMRQGDMVILNDPFAGGTHLPDLTLIAPLFEDASPSEPQFFVATRAHHADIGGKVPGSLLVEGQLRDEGLVIAPTHLIHHHRLVDETLTKITQASRTPEERHGDLMAQVAANQVGQKRLTETMRQVGLKPLRKMVRQLLSYSEAMMNEEIRAIPEGGYAFEDYLENVVEGPPEEGPTVDQDLVRIMVKISFRNGIATVDFSGTAPQNTSSLNTVLPVTEAAVLYVLMAIAKEDFPVNAGCLKPLRLIAPEGTLIHARPPAAVSAGNVETSQRIVDVCLGALTKALPERIPAASAGTMNNLCIGGTYPFSHQQFAYYETLAGGQGASLGHAGESAIQMHMTNTRNTPIEVLEHAYPLRIESYRIRSGSGGEGIYPGGEGMERVYRFLQPMTVTLVTDRRIYPPYGLKGGGDGALGVNTLERDGHVIPVPGKVTLTVKPGDLLRILTPGGGGYGKK